MESKLYWSQKHPKYQDESWIAKPSLFAQRAIHYFPPSGTLLDLGAGQGQDSRYFAKNGFKVTSSDFADVALSISQQKAREEGLDISFKNLDLARPLPFENQSFDVIYSHLALHYFDDITTEQLFTEIHRVLKPQGIVAMILNTIDDPEVEESEQLEKGLYKAPSGLIKRFFDLQYLEEKTRGKFETLLINNEGETHKDEIKTLVQFIGKKPSD